MEKMKVNFVYPIKEKQQLYLVLDINIEFNFIKFKPIYLYFGNNKVKIKFACLSNINGKPVIAAVLDDSRYFKVEEIGILEHEEIFIECAIV